MFKNKIKPTKTEVYSILTGMFCASLIISNILAFKTFSFYGDIVLPCAVIIFPLTYIINDVLAEVYGFSKAKTVILLGFLMNLVAVLCYTIAILLPSPVYFDGQEAFALVLSNTPRILIASFIAYLVGSLLNSYSMVKMKEKYEPHLFGRCICSTIIGEGVDACLFITIAFFGTMPNTMLLIMIIAQATFKTVYEIIIYPFTRYVINKIKKLEE